MEEKKQQEQDKFEKSLRELREKYEQARKAFEEDYNIFSGQVTTFQEQIKYLMKKKNEIRKEKLRADGKVSKDLQNPDFLSDDDRRKYGIELTENNIAKEVGIEERTLSSYSNGHRAPSMNTLIAICIVMRLDIKQATALLASLGVCFSGCSKEHYAYMYLLENHRGKTIKECNEILLGLGVDKQYLLHPRKKAKKNLPYS